MAYYIPIPHCLKKTGGHVLCVNYAHEATCSMQHNDEQVRNTIFNYHDAHGILML